jgi:FG-GAP-like repeat
VLGDIVTTLALGTCSITASQSGNAIYVAAAVVTQSFTVIQASQTITFDTVPNQILGVSPFVLAAEASSHMPVGFVSTTSAVCKNSSNLVMLLSAGTCSITATQPGNANYAAASATRSFAVKLARPSSGFILAPGSPFSSVDPVPLAVGDFNGDGIPDLAIGNYGISTPNLTVLLGSGTGGFTPAPGSPFAAGLDPTSIAVGDFNGAGIADLAMGVCCGPTVLLGNGSGGFTAAPSPPAGGFYAVGDFNEQFADALQPLGEASGNIGEQNFLGMSDQKSPCVLVDPRNRSATQERSPAAT